MADREPKELGAIDNAEPKKVRTIRDMGGRTVAFAVGPNGEVSYAVVGLPQIDDLES